MEDFDSCVNIWAEKTTGDWSIQFFSPICKQKPLWYTKEKKQTKSALKRRKKEKEKKCFEKEKEEKERKKKVFLKRKRRERENLKETSSKYDLVSMFKTSFLFIHTWEK